MSAIRDEMCGAEVGVIAELGGIEKEFVVYGCAYQEAGKTKYRVSTSAQEIYDFVRSAYREGLWPTPIEQLLYRAVTAASEEEALLEKLRRELGCQMRKDYPATFFEALMLFAESSPKDQAVPLLEKLQARLDGRFNADELQLFAEIVNEAGRQKLLSTASRLSIQQWIRKIEMQMADDVIVKERFAKTFYGFAHRLDQGATPRYELGAEIGRVWEKHQQAQRAGELTTPILTKTIWFAEYREMPQARKHCEDWLRVLLSEQLWEVIAELESLSSGLDQVAYRQMLRQAQALPTKSVEALQNYGLQWHIR